MPVSPRYAPAPIHLRLGDGFFDAVAPAQFPQHVLRYRQQRWAGRIGLETLTEDEWIEHFGRFAPLPDNLPEPLALRYHGHQFRSYNPDLGDGRGFLFAQMRDDAGRILDLGTKGSGHTPYSRTADGRLTLKGGVREVLATTMLEALGVNTSKTFSLIETGEALHRGDEPSPTRSSVLVRLSHSHIRIGTFQRLAYERDAVRIQRLVDHVLEYYMPGQTDADAAPAARAVAMFSGAVARIARTGAQWMAAGFVHGVLNTDNINITGESFDYGPYRFLPHHDATFTAAYFDHSGLYAYGRQPETLFWNLQRLAECLLPVCEKEPLVAALQAFPAAFEDAMAAATLARLNLATAGKEADGTLTDAVFAFLDATRMPFEQFFFDWYGGRESESRATRGPAAEHYRAGAFAPLRDAMGRHTVSVPARLTDAYFGRDRPETLLIDEIEALWLKISEAEDWRALDAKCAAIERAGQARGTIAA